MSILITHAYLDAHVVVQKGLVRFRLWKVEVKVKLLHAVGILDMFGDYLIGTQQPAEEVLYKKL